MILSLVSELAPEQELGSRPGISSKARLSQAAFLSTTMLAALLLRLLVVACVYHIVAAPTLDHNEFGWEMGWTARSIALGQGFSSPFLPATGPTALVPPLYVYLLAGIFKLFGLYTAKAALVVLGLNSLLSSLTVLPIYFSSRHALDARRARIAAIAWAIYPFSIYFSAFRVWDYALTALLLCLCFWAAQKLHLRGWPAWLGFGALCGLAVLSNPSVLPIFCFLALLALVKVHRVQGPAMGRALVVALAFAAVAAPWCVRNYRVMHQSSVIRDGFWLEFWAGNHGDTSDSNPGSAHPASSPVEMQQYQASGEVAYLAQKRVMAIDFLRHHPVFFAECTARRIGRFWTGFWSFRREYREQEPSELPNLFFCTTLTLLLLRGAWRWRKEDLRAALPYLFAIAVFPIPYYLTHSSMDYRQPIEPLIVVLVVVGIFGVEDRPDSPALPGFAEAYDEGLEDEPSVVRV